MNLGEEEIYTKLGDAVKKMKNEWSDVEKSNKSEESGKRFCIRNVDGD